MDTVNQSEERTCMFVDLADFVPTPCGNVVPCAEHTPAPSDEPKPRRPSDDDWIRALASAKTAKKMLESNRDADRTDLTAEPKDAVKDEPHWKAQALKCAEELRAKDELIAHLQELTNDVPVKEEGFDADYVDVVFDGPPSNVTGRFVECESPAGVGVKVGEWIDRGDGYWVLRIPRRSTAPLESRCLNPRCDGRHVTSAEWTPNGPGHVPMRPLGNRLDVRKAAERAAARIGGITNEEMQADIITDELSALMEGK